MSRAGPASSPGSRIEAAFGAPSATCSSCPAGLVPDFDDQLYFDRGIEREHRRTDRAARMPACLAEYLQKQFTGPVHDLRLPREVGRAGDEASQLDDTGYRRKAACHGRRRCERVERAGPGERGRLSSTDLCPDLPGGQQLAV